MSRQPQPPDPGDPSSSRSSGTASSSGGSSSGTASSGTAGDRDAGLGGALSGLPVPDHGPTFWAELSDRLTVTDQGETAVASPTESVTAPAGDAGAAPVGLDEQRARRAARRGGRTVRSLGAAAAAVALVVAAAGAVAVIRSGDHGHQVRTADRPAGTANPAPPPGPAAPAEFSAQFDGIDATLTQPCPVGTCLPWRLTVAQDGSFRWTRSDGSVDMAFDAISGAGRQVEVVSRGEGASPSHPNAFVTTGVPAGGPDQRITKPEPLGPIADFVVALARAGDTRVTATTARVSGRAAWHYDGPIVQDRLGGDGAPNHAVADVDQATGVLLELTRSDNGKVISHFVASDVKTTTTTDRSKYHLDPPRGAKTQPFSIGFVSTTLDGAAAGLPYPLLVPGRVPAGFTLEAVSVDRDVASSTGAEGLNPPARQVVAMTWRNGMNEFTVTLRPKGADQWNDPLGAEGLVLDAQPVHLDLDGRPPLDGQVAVDAPIRPHLWGITGDVVVTISGGLPRADLERVAGSLRPRRSG